MLSIMAGSIDERLSI